MYKIFRYECKRLFCNKFFFGFVLVLLFYGWQVLNRITLLGVSHTAPFSPWSFGDYLSRMLPLLWAGALFFLTFFTSTAAQRREVLTAATPMKPTTYGLIRCCAALLGTVVLSLATLLLAVVFYGRLFHWYDWSALLLPAFLTLTPPLVFALGSGWAVGRLRPWLLLLWLPFPLLLQALPLPDFLSLLNGSIFVDRPLALGILDPPFSLPAKTILAQGLIFLTGGALLAKQPQNILRKNKRKLKRKER